MLYAGATAIAGSLKDVSQLQTLALRSNRLRDAGATAIAGSLKDVPQLQTLNLRCNGIGDAGATAIGRLGGEFSGRISGRG